MSAWPDRLKVGPIREWPGEMTRTRRYSPFRGSAGKITKLSVTLGELDRELRELRATNVELLVAIAPEKFRLDGRPRADATAIHPGVILSFDIPKVGRVSYPCDAFTDWESNLRAVTLALEALRKVNRYGVVKHNEQYRGFLALEATATPAGFDTAAAAEKFLWTIVAAGEDYHNEAISLRTLLRRAQHSAHPDRGGDATVFQRVSLAEARLRQEGLI